MRPSIPCFGAGSVHASAATCRTKGNQGLEHTSALTLPRNGRRTDTAVSATTPCVSVGVLNSAPGLSSLRDGFKRAVYADSCARGAAILEVENETPERDLDDHISVRSRSGSRALDELGGPGDAAAIEWKLALRDSFHLPTAAQPRRHGGREGVGNGGGWDNAEHHGREDARQDGGTLCGTQCRAGQQEVYRRRLRADRHRRRQDSLDLRYARCRQIAAGDELRHTRHRGRHRQVRRHHWEGAVLMPSHAYIGRPWRLHSSGYSAQYGLGDQAVTPAQSSARRKVDTADANLARAGLCQCRAAGHLATHSVMKITDDDSGERYRASV